MYVAGADQLGAYPSTSHEQRQRHAGWPDGLGMTDLESIELDKLYTGQRKMGDPEVRPWLATLRPSPSQRAENAAKHLEGLHGVSTVVRRSKRLRGLTLSEAGRGSLTKRPLRRGMFCNSSASCATMGGSEGHTRRTSRRTLGTLET